MGARPRGEGDWWEGECRAGEGRGMEMRERSLVRDQAFVRVGWGGFLLSFS